MQHKIVQSFTCVRALKVNQPAGLSHILTNNGEKI